MPTSIKKRIKPSYAGMCFGDKRQIGAMGKILKMATKAPNLPEIGSVLILTNRIKDT
jgi:hypothetical protein